MTMINIVHFSIGDIELSWRRVTVFHLFVYYCPLGI